MANMNDLKKSQSSIAQVKSKVKVVFLGDQSTGKTSILLRFILDKFEESPGPTVGIDFMAKNIPFANQLLRLQLWDTAGQERFRSLIPSYLKDASITIIVFDLSNIKSFENIHEWIDLCQSNRNEKNILIVVGNKVDLLSQRQVPKEVVAVKIQELSVPYFEVSAKTGSGVTELFQYAGNTYATTNILASDLSMSSIFHDKVMEASNLQKKQEESDKKKSERRDESGKKEVQLTPKAKLQNKRKCC